MAGNIKEMTIEGLHSAFRSKLNDLYNGYYQCVVQADNDEAKLKEADERFRRGVKIAKQALTDSLRLSD
jgi:hypothetical protein